MLEAPPAVAVNVADWAVLTAVAVAVKATVVAPAATVVEDGTVTAVSLLERLTVAPPVPAAELSVTVQMSVPDPVSELLAQLSALTGGTTAAPVPLNATVVADVLALLATVSSPVAAPVDVGANSAVMVYVLPELTVAGRLLVPTIENDSPLIAICVISTLFRVSLRSVILIVDDSPTVTLPKAAGLGETTKTTELLPFIDRLLPHPIGPAMHTSNAGIAAMPARASAVERP